MTQSISSKDYRNMQGGKKARHSWNSSTVKTKRGKPAYYVCTLCGCTKEKEYGMPWVYFTDKDMFLKAPACKSPQP
jgi:hypothetical protein